MWPDRPHKLTKQTIQVVTCLNAIGEILGVRKVQNTIVTVVTKSQIDSRSMTISDIIEHDVRFASMVTGYKIYQSSRQNFVSDTAIFATYQTLKEDKRYDFFVVLLSELLSNLKKIKQDKKNVFKFGSLIVFLALYFLNQNPSIGKI